jgi:hypothetical protein
MGLFRPENRETRGNPWVKLVQRLNIMASQIGSIKAWVFSNVAQPHWPAAPSSP